MLHNLRKPAGNICLTNAQKTKPALLSGSALTISGWGTPIHTCSGRACPAAPAHTLRPLSAPRPTSAPRGAPVQGRAEAQSVPEGAGSHPRVSAASSEHQPGALTHSIHGTLVTFLGVERETHDSKHICLQAHVVCQDL